MNRFDWKEQKIKLELIAAIARSQHALARILDNIADISDLSPSIAKHIGENVHLLTQMQEAMTQSVTGLSLQRSNKRKGHPTTRPWLNPHINQHSPVYHEQER